MFGQWLNQGDRLWHYEVCISHFTKESCMKTFFNRTAGECKDGEQAGNVPFMSPETLKGKEYSRPADLWALGVCAYKLVMGSLPFRDRDSQKLRCTIFTTLLTGRQISI